MKTVYPNGLNLRFTTIAFAQDRLVITTSYSKDIFAIGEITLRKSIRTLSQSTNNILHYFLKVCKRFNTLFLNLQILLFQLLTVQIILMQIHRDIRFYILLSLSLNLISFLYKSRKAGA